MKSESPPSPTTTTRPPPAPPAAADVDINPIEIAATALETRAEFVRRTGSGYTLLRHSLVQKREGKQRASTLSKFVNRRKRRALLLYLLLLTGWDPDRKPHRSDIWIRALDVPGGTTWSKSSISQAWSDLEGMDLIKRKRERRLARVVPRREDGAAEYTRPDGQKDDPYFVLPGEFWTDDWFDKLSLPALAVLLILLKETNDDDHEIHLTYEQTGKWYGFSASSAQKGYQELIDAGLVTVRREGRKAPFAPEGFTVHLHYSLNGVFSTDSRAAAREAARTAGENRRKPIAKKVARPRKRKALAPRAEETKKVRRIKRPTKEGI